MDIQELKKQLDYLEETKQLIKEQLVAKGQPVDENTTFREYVDNMDILIDTEDGNIASNDLELGKKAYSKGAEIVGTYNPDRDLGIKPLATFTISDDQTNLQKYYADAVEQGGIAALANLKSWQIRFKEKALNSQGKPKEQTVEFMSFTPAIIEIGRFGNSGDNKKYLFNTNHTALFVQFARALGVSYVDTFINEYNITEEDLLQMSGWYEAVNGVLVQMNGNPSYSNICIIDIGEYGLQDAMQSRDIDYYVPYINLDEVNLNCTFTIFDTQTDEMNLVEFIKGDYMKDAKTLTADVIGQDMVAYGGQYSYTGQPQNLYGNKIVGTVPIINTNDYYLLQKTETLGQSGDYVVNWYNNNYNGTGVTELIMTNGDKLDVSTLPENVENKNICIVYGKDKYNFDRWNLFIADLDTTFCFSSHDNTYAIGCRDKATRVNSRNMVYYQGYRTHSDDNPLDINTVNWGEQKQFGPSSYLVELYLYGDFSAYATNDVYRGQFGIYSSTIFAGSEHYKYYVDTRLGHNASPLAYKTSLLLKNNSHIYTPINITELATKENITADKIKKDVTIMGVTGTLEEGIDTSDATAVTNDIVSGKTAYVNGQKLTGDLTTYASGEKFEQTISMTAAYDSATNMLLLGSNPGQCAFKGGTIELSCSGNTIATSANITANKIAMGETVLGIVGTYMGTPMKEYASVTDMNNDIANISDGELVKVVESGTTSYFIKETIDNVPTMTKLVKESETMSPQEYEDANDIADEILGE